MFLTSGYQTSCRAQDANSAIVPLASTCGFFGYLAWTATADNNAQPADTQTPWPWVVNCCNLTAMHLSSESLAHDSSITKTGNWTATGGYGTLSASYGQSEETKYGTTLTTTVDALKIDAGDKAMWGYAPWTITQSETLTVVPVYCNGGLFPPYVWALYGGSPSKMTRTLTLKYEQGGFNEPVHCRPT